PTLAEMARPSRATASTALPTPPPPRPRAALAGGGAAARAEAGGGGVPLLPPAPFFSPGVLRGRARPPGGRRARGQKWPGRAGGRWGLPTPPARSRAAA